MLNLQPSAALNPHSIAAAIVSLLQRNLIAFMNSSMVVVYTVTESAIFNGFKIVRYP